MRPISTTRHYSIDLATWTCNCGQQKYNAYVLCKHLVQSVQPQPSPEFFAEANIRHTTPFYRHHQLQPRSMQVVDSIDDGSITDGDDHIFNWSHGPLPLDNRRALRVLRERGRKRLLIDTDDATENINPSSPKRIDRSITRSNAIAAVHSPNHQPLATSSVINIISSPAVSEDKDEASLEEVRFI